METKDIITLIIAIFGALLGVINTIISIRSTRRENDLEKRTLEIENERDLDYVTDLFSGLKEGEGSPTIQVKEIGSPKENAHIVSLNTDTSGLEKGRRLIRNILIRDPQNIRAKQLLALYLDVSGDKEGSLSIKQELANKQPQNPWATYEIGRTLLNQSYWDKAIPLLRKALEQDENEHFLQTLKSALWSKKNSIKRSKNSVDQIRELDNEIKEIDERLLFVEGKNAVANWKNPNNIISELFFESWEITELEGKKILKGHVINGSKVNYSRANVEFQLYDEHNMPLDLVKKSLGKIRAGESKSFEISLQASNAAKARWKSIGGAGDK